jgi:hypothetical protein
MGRTFIRQDTQIMSSDSYDDTIAPTEATYETNPTNIEQNLNHLRSMLSYLKDIQAGNWWDTQTAPSTLEAGSLRGVDDLNDALHVVEKKRVLKHVWNLHSITGGSGQGVALGAGELPSNTTAAVGAVTTLGTVVAQATAFGTYSASDDVAGPTAISPKNLLMIVDAATRDPILDSGGERIYGLLQTESGSDGHTMTGTTPNRAQISYVKLNATGDDLELITAGDMNGKTFDFAAAERVRLEDLNEADFLGGADVDVPSGATVTRQVAYDNQGATAVNITASATLDLEGAGLSWTVRDDLEAMLFQIVEGSAGSTSQVNIGADVDEFDIDALVVDFDKGITANSGGTRPITVGVNDGEIETTSGDLKLHAATQLAFQDLYYDASTWGTDLVLSDASGEWDAYETAFGEVSLLNAIVQAAGAGTVTKVYSVVTSDIAANNDASGPSNDNNLDADLGDLSGGTFLTDYDVFLNGELLRPGADAAANHDYYPGTALGNGQLKFEFNLKSTGANPDVLCVIKRA